MYWNNPLISLTWPTDQDPIANIHSTSQHCLFWNPNYDFKAVTSRYNLTDFCNELNEIFDQWGQSVLGQQSLAHSNNQYALTNMVKFNIWVADLRKRGNIKPWLILDQGDGTYLAGTGDSRLKCLELVNDITHVQAFISTRAERAHLYRDLEPVTTLAQFVHLCQAQEHDQFLFRMTDPSAPYALYWYEHANHSTSAVTPGDDQALAMLRNYLDQHPNTRVSPDWFNTAIDWDCYRP
jgi:hypothetical protein